MKATRFFTLCCLLFFAIHSQAQEQENKTYRITETGSVRDMQPYIQAMNKANMQYHRLKDSRHTITFDTGLKVELFSAKELAAAGLTINPDNYPENFDPARQEPAFFLGQNNHIIEMHHSDNKLKN